MMDSMVIARSFRHAKHAAEHRGVLLVHTPSARLRVKRGSGNDYALHHLMTTRLPQPEQIRRDRELSS